MEKRTFEPGEHLVFKRIVVGKVPKYYQEYSFSIGHPLYIPDGYKMISIQPSSAELVGHRTVITADIWLINTKRVVVEYEEKFLEKEGGYNNPGKVVEEGPRLNLRP